MKKYPRAWVEQMDDVIRGRVITVQMLHWGAADIGRLIMKARPRDYGNLDRWRAWSAMYSWMIERVREMPEESCPWDVLRDDFWARFNEEQGGDMTLIQIRQETMEKVCRINQDIKTVLLEQRAAIDNGLLCAEGLLASKLAELLEKRRPLAELVQVLDDIEQEKDQ